MVTTTPNAPIKKRRVWIGEGGEPKTIKKSMDKPRKAPALPPKPTPAPAAPRLALDEMGMPTRDLGDTNLNKLYTYARVKAQRPVIYEGRYYLDVLGRMVGPIAVDPATADKKKWKDRYWIAGNQPNVKFDGRGAAMAPNGSPAPNCNLLVQMGPRHVIAYRTLHPEAQDSE